MEQNNNDSQIVIKNLTHQYTQDKRALSELNLNIGVGLFGLLGANGAGKSTLMRIICTLLEPTNGEVTVNGFNVVKQRSKVRQLIGYLPQEFGAWRLQKVEEVLDTLAMLSGMTDKSERQQRIEQILASVGLSEVAQRKVKQLSGGMLRRLGIAQALVHDPLVLVMDEPTVGLDPEERQRFRELIGKIARDRIIILSTHIIADLGASCAQMALLNAGQLEFTGAPSELIAQAKGKVFEISLPPVEAQKFEQCGQFEVVGRAMVDNNSVLRGVSKDGQMPEGGQEADNITLEEAYLAHTLGFGVQAQQSLN